VRFDTRVCGKRIGITGEVISKVYGKVTLTRGKYMRVRGERKERRVKE
jgi:hypothetical protein